VGQESGAGVGTGAGAGAGGPDGLPPVVLVTPAAVSRRAQRAMEKAKLRGGWARSPPPLPPHSLPMAVVRAVRVH
jgi:hypothetical protein